MSRIEWRETYFNEEPSKIDTTSSRAFVRIRKNIEYVQGDGEYIESHWKCLEQKIPVEDWELYRQIMDHDSALNDIYDGMAEIASIVDEIAGGI